MCKRSNYTEIFPQYEGDSEYRISSKNSMYGTPRRVLKYVIAMVQMTTATAFRTADTRQTSREPLQRRQRRDIIMKDYQIIAKAHIKNCHIGLINANSVAGSTRGRAIKGDPQRRGGVLP